MKNRLSKEETLHQIESSVLVAVVRLDDVQQLYPTIDALLSGGVNLIEATMTIPGLLAEIPSLMKEYGDRIVLGIGSILDARVAEEVIQSGASFIVSPVMKPELIGAAKKLDCAVSVGAFTPTEIQTAWELGSDIVKVFPAEVLGPAFIKGVRAPMPHLKLMPTGGVNVATIPNWINAGSVALGVGSALVDMKAVRANEFEKIESNAKELVMALNATR